MKNRTSIVLFALIVMISCNTKSENENSTKKEIAPKVTDSILDKQKDIDSTKEKKEDIKELANKVNLKIESVEKIDFDGDGTKDFICKGIVNQQGLQNEYWIDSNFKIVKNKLVSIYGRLYRQYINLDEDKEPEIFEVDVYDDGADYVILDQNLKTGKDKIVMYYNPVIIENNNYYWGYPWDVTSIMSKEENGQVKLYCSLNHNIERDGNEESYPKHQKQMPVIFFNGKHTQEGNEKKISNLKWLTLQEIVKLIER
jgi:hypothetical protein